MSRGYRVEVKVAPVVEYDPLRVASTDHADESHPCLSARATDDIREVRGEVVPCSAYANR